MHCMLLVSKKLRQRPEGILQDEKNERKNLMPYLKVWNKLLYINVYLVLKIWINITLLIKFELHYTNCQVNLISLQGQIKPRQKNKAHLFIQVH